MSHVPSRDCFGHLGKEKKLSPINLQWFPIGGLFLMVMLQEITFYLVVFKVLNGHGVNIYIKYNTCIKE